MATIPRSVSNIYCIELREAKYEYFAKYTGLNDLINY